MAQTKGETIKVTIKSPDRPDIEQTVEKSYSVKKVKQLAAQVNIPANSHRLLRVDGKQLTDNDNHCFEEDLVVHVHHAFELYIQMPRGNRIAILADPLDTIQTVKNLIHLKTKVPAEEQELRFHIHLLNDELVLIDYGIENGYTLTMTRHPVWSNYTRTRR